MAGFSGQFYSFLFQKNVDVNVFVPEPSRNEQVGGEEKILPVPYEKGLPVVYLLHGAYGTYASWVRQSAIERYAQEHGVVAVMASADNSFYQNMVHGEKYETFFTEELPTFIEHVFPVSKKREDTGIIGFSMGGYGAWFLALSHPEKYGWAASMSGALDIAATYEAGNGGSMESPFRWQDIFSDPGSLRGSRADIFCLLETCKRENTLPNLYQACGTEDFLYEMNRQVKSRMDEMEIPVRYEEGAGAHDWKFWDTYIQRILDWMTGR